MAERTPFLTLAQVPDPDGTYRYVPVDEGFAAPRCFEVTTAHLDDGAALSLRIRLDTDGAPHCTRVGVWGDNLSSEDLRLPLSRLVRDAVAFAAVPISTQAGPRPDFVTALNHRGSEGYRDFYERYTAQARRPRRGAAITDEQLQQVADLYRAAIDHGDPPTQTVAEQLHIARSTAGRWVAKARERGKLGPALTARAGETAGK